MIAWTIQIGSCSGARPPQHNSGHGTHCAFIVGQMPAACPHTPAVLRIPQIAEMHGTYRLLLAYVLVQWAISHQICMDSTDLNSQTSHVVYRTLKALK